MKLIALILIISLSTTICYAQFDEIKIIEKNHMKVSWHYENEQIFFEMSAPTDGWITIGFNTHSGIIGAYLLMGNIINKKINVVEHYTKSPGNYSSFLNLGIQSNVHNKMGDEKQNHTTIKFSLPIKAMNKYQKDLSEGNEYTMILAYSQEDDFQHHSIMRTAINVKL